MRKTKEQKAITLIALIITMVVLLILAVVAINAVTGDGIIQHAVNAKTEYEKAQTEEEMMLSNYETFLKGNVDTWDGESKKAPKIKDGDWYIYTCSEFKFFADFVNGDLTDTEKDGLEINENTTVYLMSNLDLGAKQTDGVWGGTEWTPIGKDTNNGFVGIFEGNNHYITGVYIDDGDGYAGIFGYSTNTIKNLTIKDGYIKATGMCVGGIVGYGKTIINCNNVSVTIKNTGESLVIGGVAGIGTTVENCINSGLIIPEGMKEGATRAGGVVGNTPTKNGNEVKIKNCKNVSDINSNTSAVGGVIGQINPGASIENCVNTGNITGVDNIGGIIGAIANYTVENPYGNVNNCYNIGNITGNGQIGGIIGNLSLKTNRIVKACYNTGEIKGNNNTGAIIGCVLNKETNYENIKNLYYLEESSAKGIGNMADATGIVDFKSEEYMKKNAFATELNRITNTDVWVGSDGQYPRLKWEK